MADMTLRYNCVALAGVNRPAEYKRDENGYYYVVANGFNCVISDAEMATIKKTVDAQYL